MYLDQDIIVKKHNKRLLVFPHTGMGDHLIVYGAIRQLSYSYDEIKNCRIGSLFRICSIFI